MQPEDYNMCFGGSHFGQFAFDGAMQSMDDGLMQRVWWCSGGDGILAQRMYLLGSRKSDGDNT